MIDVVGTVAAAAAVNTPTIIETADTQDGALSSTISFGIGDLLARVNGNLPGRP